MDPLLMTLRNYPLTRSQESIWLGQQFHKDLPLYNMAHAFHIKGALDAPVFKRAFQFLIDQTESLRLVFSEVDSTPRQYVLESVPYELDTLDYSGKSRADLKKYLESRSQLILNLSDRVFDSALLKTGDKEFIWFLNIHHLATDATTSTILFQNMSRLYGLLKNGHRITDADSTAFTDYILFEKSNLEAIHMTKSREHWIEKSRTAKKLPGLYGHKGGNRSTASRRVSLELGPDRSKKIKELAEHPEIRTLTSDLSLFNIFATLLFVFIYRISGQGHITIGAPSHNRSKGRFKKTAGLLVEFFTLESELSDTDTYRAVLNRMQRESYNYLRHAQPGASNNYLQNTYNAVLNYIAAEFPEFDSMAVESEWIHTGFCDHQHELRCHVADMDRKGEITLIFDLNNRVFPPQIIDNVPLHFLKLVDSLLADLDASILEAELITRDEKDALMGTPISGHQIVPALSHWRAMLEQHPTSVAIECNDRRWSYLELEERSNQVVLLLKGEKVKPGDKIGLHMFRSADFIVGILAIWKIQACYIPIPSDTPKARLRFILEDSGSALLITDQRLLNNSESISIPKLVMGKGKPSNASRKANLPWDLPGPESPAYLLYTSGSTGNPKGVAISHGALSNYLNWALKYYKTDRGGYNFPFFTSIGFDLTVTSVFLPLLSGGRLTVYEEASSGPDISLLEVLQNSSINAIKLTPSHLAMVRGIPWKAGQLKIMIVGGEALKTSLARSYWEALGSKVRIFNEYGPTEATVGCIAGEFLALKHLDIDVPIGRPISNMQAYVLDKNRQLVPPGVKGELYLTGRSLSLGYLGQAKNNNSVFQETPFVPGSIMYRTGDLARWNHDYELEYLGRIDDQLKVNGYRIEPKEVETALISLPAVEQAVVLMLPDEGEPEQTQSTNCVKCGLTSSFPNTEFDEKGVCNFCNAFPDYSEKVSRYFKKEEDLIGLFDSKKGIAPKYDCLSLLSGGKDSTYVLSRLVDMGLRVLAFTLDNGYISDQAKANIDKVVRSIGVDHIYGQTPHMNAIFVDSLHRHDNVCNGCFKTIYTLATQVALEHNIPFIVTGLSRGQFFETRLSEELFWEEVPDTKSIDETILQARRLYHKEEDAVSKYLDVGMFEDASTFERVQFVDFFRYCDVKLEEMLRYLKDKLGWLRPTDTGRSTNCLINQVGIRVHKQRKGFSNYSFPYSWDVRLGHKTREEALEEIDEPIDEAETNRIMNEIGYQGLELQDKKDRLIAFYTSENRIPSQSLNKLLSEILPAFMLPSYYKRVEKFPLTANGKIDKKALGSLNRSQLEMEAPFTAPSTEIETLVAGIWREVLQLQKIGIHDNFLALGGHSLAAIRVNSRLKNELGLELPLGKIFENPTIASYAGYVEYTLTEIMKQEEL